MMKSVIFFGLVFALHHVNGGSIGCSTCHGSSYGSYVEEHHHRQGCGFPFPLRKECGKFELPQSDWCSDRTDRHCVPLVVRPHDIPKPTINPAVALDLAKIVPNPCAIKKAIVKPAVLPKPICKSHGRETSAGYASGCSAGYAAGYDAGCGKAESSCCGSLSGAGPCYGSGFSGLIGHGVAGVAFGGSGHHGSFGFGPLAPADVVSLDIANKLAREANMKNILCEDRLNFGFRKLPLELPPKKVVLANVPEEGIFQLNGQVVELKPIVPCAGSSAVALAEEAAEQLLALEEEEANEGVVVGSEVQPGIRRVSLCEIGYGVATPPNPSLITLPEAAASVGSQDISTNCGCGNFGHGYGCGGSACGQIGGCTSCGAANECNCKIIPGNVEFETKPKLPQICLPPIAIPDSCESAEIELSEENNNSGSGITCSCVPVCLHHRKQSNCKKSCYTVEKIFV